MKKRILSILLCLCMAACMLPTAAFAADTGKAIQLGTDALSKNVNTEAAPTVYFGQDHGNNPAAWRVIGYDGSGVAGAQGDMTLLAAGTMGEAAFDSVNYSSEYAPSELKTAIDALEAKLTTEENAAVKKRTLASGSYNGENTDCVAGAQVDNAVFWPLSIAEAHAVNQDLRIVNKEHTNWAMYHWWLRSPCKSSSSAAVVHGNGEVLDDGMYHTSDEFGVRPAFNLNLNAVLFASAAVGGKPDGGLTPISEYTGSEWKLTLLDNSRNFAVTEKAVSGDPDGTLTLHYSGATTGTNEYISVILADNSGAKYYGRVAQPTEATGTVEIKIPSDIAPGSYTLKVFSEQYNGDHKTDYASDFTDIALTVGKQMDEQFNLDPDGTYYFDLSGESIPSTVNDSLPDKTMHYVPFTYAGTVDAYKLTSAMATTEEYAQEKKYDHSLFIADYNVTHNISWDDLNTANLIFGKDYAAGGVDYTLRAPSVGSGRTYSGESQRGTPLSNEWDKILDKDSGYIKNWSEMSSWGQDTKPDNSIPIRANRGNHTARHWNYNYATFRHMIVGFRPVLEVLNPDALGADGLKVVTIALGGGKLGNSSEEIQIIAKNGSEFTAPASNGLTRPDGNTENYFKWLGSDGTLYAPGDSVPANVTKLTAQFAPPEQFNLALGGTYYFDLFGESIPGTANSDLPDSTLHYVPFTYAGTVDAYKLTSEKETTEEYAQQFKYLHSLFVADYAVTHTVSWNDLNTAGLIFGKDYTADGVDYTLRAPSTGSGDTGSGESRHGTPSNNEWDRILDKNSGYVKNWNGKISSWGQDVFSGSTSHRAVRGFYSARSWAYALSSNQHVTLGFRPVLEVRNPNTLSPDGLKAVTLDLGGGKLGNSSEDIQIIVKNGSAFTAPTSDGLTRPDGNNGSSFKWLGSDGKLYAPDESVPADVIKLTAQFVGGSSGGGGGGGSRKPSVTYYTLHFETNGGSAITDMWEASNTRISLTKYVPTRQGHTFIGWYSDQSLTNQISEVSLTKNMTVYAGWRADENPDTVVNPFTDVSEKDWFYNDAMFVYKNGLMLGTSKTLFSPHGTVTRGMMATILWRMEGSLAPKDENSFTDVEAGRWYADAITWTTENGIFAGYSKDK
ncbi:S-layer homology domain-containing protein, partial [Anaerotignum faecicola]